MDDVKRQNLTSVALEALNKAKHPRTYALTNEARNALAVLAAAVYERRTAQGRSYDDKPTAREELTDLIEKLAPAGVNILQNRPGDPKQKSEEDQAS